MKRISDRTSDVPQSTDRRVRPNNARDPLPGQEGVSLAQALEAKVLEDPDLEDVRDLILEMQQSEPVPGSAEDKSDRLHSGTQQAIDLLLELGQDELLRRLVQRRPGGTYTLNIGSSAQKLQVLVDLGAVWWPEHVSISLSSSLPAHLVSGLRPFLTAPSSLSITVVADSVPDLAAAAVFAESMRWRPQSLQALTIVVPPSPALEMLQALPGVKARHLALQVGELANAPRAAVEEALVAIVGASDGERLNIARCGLADPYTVNIEPFPHYPNDCFSFIHRLVRSRPHWDVLTLSLMSFDGLPAYPTTVTRLELLADALLNCTPEAMAKLHALQVHTFFTTAMVDVAQFAASVKSPVWIERIEAYFGGRDGDDYDAAFRAIESNFAIFEIHHHRNEGSWQKGYWALHALDQERFAELTRRNRLIRATRSRTLEDPETWEKAVKRIRNLLDPAQTLGDVLMGIGIIVQTLPVRETSMLYVNAERSSTQMEHKLRCLLQCEEILPAVRAAMVRASTDNPVLGLAICRVLIQWGTPMRERTAQEWRALARPWRGQWISDQLTQTQRENLSPTLLSMMTNTNPQLPARVPIAYNLSAQRAPGPLASFEPAPYVRLEGFLGVADLAARVSRRAVDMHLQTADPGIAGAEIAALQLVQRSTVFLPPVSPRELSWLSRLLLLEGQARLVQAYVSWWMAATGESVWTVDVDDADIAAQLEKMTAWPATGGVCNLRVSTSLSEPSLAALSHFARLVPLGALRLCLKVGAHDILSAWSGCADLLRGRSGAVLEVSVDAGHPLPHAFPTHHLTHMLKALEAPPEAGAALYGLMLNGLRGASAQAVQDLSSAVLGTKVMSLSMENCSDSLAHALATCQPWRHLALEISRPMADVFLQGAVTAIVLQLYVENAFADRGALVQDMIGACKGLDYVTLDGGPVDVGALAHGLDRNRSARGFRADLTMASRVAGEAALALLQKNASIVNANRSRFNTGIDPQAPQPIAADMWKAITDAATYNAMRDPQLSAIGAGKGFGFSYGANRGLGDVFRDVGGIIGSMLDTRSARVLSEVSRATFAGSRRNWESAVTRLAQQFTEKVESAKGQMPPVPGNLVLRSAREALDAGTLEKAVREAVGRMLRLRVPEFEPAPDAVIPATQDERDIPWLLETLVYLGGMPPAKWLQEGLGYVIDPPA